MTKKGVATNILKSAENSRRTVLKHRTLAAEAEARQIRAAADSYAEKVAREAEEAAEKAYAGALKKGGEAALAEYQHHVLASIEIREKALQNAEQDILRLSVKLAEKILGRELRNDREAVADIITNALENARQRENLLIRVNPSDLAVAKKEIERFRSFSRAKFIDISADPRVGEGGCLIESEVGTVDARLETQFRVLETALLSKAEGEKRTPRND
ncbi:MAG: hypothetical protein HKN33_04580 [Pyrinomonadaceae bacterium]|nr:hypothetical protein [Pyrinomonadaceae bacterium]